MIHFSHALITKKSTNFTLLILFISAINSCGISDKNESNLTKKDIEYITAIIPLEDGEKIELFENNGGFNSVEQSGNFITNKRIAAYWIDGRDNRVNSIEYEQVDSIILVDLIQSVTNASYLQVYSSKQNQFKVYVDADSTRTYTFFNKALENWNDNKKKK